MITISANICFLFAGIFSLWVYLSGTPLMRARRALEIVKYYNIWKGCYKQLFSGWRPSYWTPNTFPDLCLSCKHCITKLSHRQMYSFAHCNGTLSSSGQIMKITINYNFCFDVFFCFFIQVIKSIKYWLSIHSYFVPAIFAGIVIIC